MIDLFRPFMSPDARRLVADVLTPDDEGRLFIGQGPLVDEFEREFGRLVDAPEPPLAVNSGSSALALALRLIGVGPGDEVVSTPVTCTATNGAIVNAGARIVWADVDPLTGNIDPDDVRRKLTSRTRAIVAVDWAGRRCDYLRLHFPRPGGGGDIPIVEDAAHALLAFMRGLRDLSVAHSGGHYVCWSFGPIKHLTTVVGGALLSHRGDMEHGRLLRWHGLDRRSSSDFRCAQDIAEAGYQFQMTDVNAAVGLANLPHAESLVAAHRANAAYYDRELAGLPGVTLPPPDPGMSYWLYSMLVEDRDEFIRFMASRGVQTSRVHARNDRHEAFKRAAVNPNDWLHGVDAFDAQQVSIPVGWWLTDRDRAHIVAAVHSWAERRAPVGAR
jgi:dTDP-4-amino-4,6-dideoxygalactose transaminase